MNYYKQKLYIAKVDKNDNITGKVERWEAHKKAVLHRAFTVILTYKDSYILQHRKHPVFDGYFDLSFSSHQVYENSLLQDDLTAIYFTLQREWNLKKSDLVHAPKKIGSIYYKSKDPYSEFYDHEIDYIYQIELKKVPTPNYDFAYGFSLVKRENFLKSKVYSLSSKIFAPWVKTMTEQIEVIKNL